LSGSADLISLFNLEPLYDQFLRPYLPEATTQTASQPGSPKGKEKASPVPNPDPDAKPTPPAPATPAAGLGRLSLSLGGIKLGTAADGPNGVGGKGKKVKMDKTYSHLVGDVPGKLSPASRTRRARPLGARVAQPSPCERVSLELTDAAQLPQDGTTSKRTITCSTSR